MREERIVGDLCQYQCLSHFHFGDKKSLFILRRDICRGLSLRGSGACGALLLELRQREVETLSLWASFQEPQGNQQCSALAHPSACPLAAASSEG